MRPLLILRRTTILLSAALSACSSTPPAPDWKMDAHSAIERFKSAYLSGNTALAQTEFRHAREQLASSGKIELVIDAELLRCAAQMASLVFDACTGYQQLSLDASPSQRAYARYLDGQAYSAELALLPTAQRDAANGADAGSAAHPLSALVAAGVLMRTGRATPALLEQAVATASGQGWRRPLLAWLGVQALRARQAGDTSAAERIERRIDLVLGPASH